MYCTLYMRVCVCVCDLVGLGDAGEVLQHVLNGEVHGYSRAGVAAANQPFKVLVLTDELILHGVPHHLVEKRHITTTDNHHLHLA